MKIFSFLVPITFISLNLFVSCSSSKKTNVLKVKSTPKQDSTVLFADSANNIGLAHEFFIRGLAMKQEKSNELASLFYQKALEYDPNNLFLSLETAKLLHESKQDSEAVSYIENLSKQQTDSLSAERSLLLARIYYRSSHPEKAHDFYKQTLKKEPNNGPALFELSMLLEQQKKYSELSRINEKLLPLLGYPRRMVEKQALLLRILGSNDRLIDLYKNTWQALENPDDARELIDLYVQEKRIEEAKDLLETLENMFPNDEKIKAKKVQLFVLSDQLDSALGVMRNLHNTHPQNTRYLEKLAQLEFELNESDSSTLHFNELLSRDSLNDLAWMYLGVLQLKEKKYSLADQSIRTCIRLEPTKTLYYEQFFRMHMARVEFDTAYAMMDSLEQRVPGSAEAPHFKALILLKKARFLTSAFTPDSSTLKNAKQLQKQADSLLQLAFQRDTNSADILFDLASNRERQGQKEDAISLFKKLIQQHPYDHKSLNYLGYIILESGNDLEKAGSYIDRALQIQPGNPAYLDSKAWYFYKKGQFKNAEEILEYVNKIDQTDPTLIEHLALVREALGKKKLAIESWQQLLKIDPSNQKAKSYLNSKSLMQP